MKKDRSIFILIFVLMLSMLLTGCGQEQANIQPPASNNVPVEEPDIPVDELETPEDSQSSSEETPGEEEEADDETDASSADAPQTELAASEAAISVPEPSPEQVAQPEQSTVPAPVPESAPESAPASEPAVSEPVSEPEPAPVSNTLSGTSLTLRFGGGESFTIHLYDNTTAAKIAEYVGTASWQLPIPHFDDYEGWESFQYYDIPSRYDIPSNAESVTSEKAGMVYYSHPNRIILFYQDANISSEYTPVGYIDFSQELVDAVENNPVAEGWDVKLIFIQP